ncbi:hypothetical protein D3C80_2089840 [compost metagenome]
MDGIAIGIIPFQVQGIPSMALLTDTKARNLKPADKAIAHGGVTGLTLHPSTAKGRGN